MLRKKKRRKRKLSAAALAGEGPACGELVRGVDLLGARPVLGWPDLLLEMHACLR
jgi:hypothetical protein